MPDQNFKIKLRYSEKAKNFRKLWKICMIGLDKVSENQVLRSSVAKTQQTDAERSIVTYFKVTYAISAHTIAKIWNNGRKENESSSFLWGKKSCTKILHHHSSEIFFKPLFILGMGIPTGAAVASTTQVATDIAASTGTGTSLVDNVYFQEVAGKNDNDGLMIKIFQKFLHYF